MNKRQASKSMRAFNRMAIVKQLVLKEHPAIKQFQTVAVQFGEKAVSEYCWRIGIKAFGPAWAWQSKTPYFKGIKLTKLGEGTLIHTVMSNK